MSFFAALVGLQHLPVVSADPVDLLDPAKVGLMKSGSNTLGIQYHDDILIDGRYRLEFDGTMPQEPSFQYSMYDTNAIMEGGFSWNVMAADELFGWPFIANPVFSGGTSDFTIDIVVAQGYFYITFMNQYDEVMWPMIEPSISGMHLYLLDVPDTVDPMFTYGSATIETSYADPISVNEVKALLTVTDNIDGDLTSSIVVEADEYTSVSPKVVGTSYSILFSAEDAASNKAYLEIQVEIIDDVKPYWEYMGQIYEDGEHLYIDFMLSDVMANWGTNSYALYEYLQSYLHCLDAVPEKAVNVIGGFPPFADDESFANIYADFNQSYTSIGFTLTAFDEYNNEADLHVTIEIIDDIAPVMEGPQICHKATTATFPLNDVIQDYIVGNVTDIYVHEFAPAYTSEHTYTVVSDGYTGNESIPGTYPIVFKIEDGEGNFSYTMIAVKVIDLTVPVFVYADPVLTVSAAAPINNEDLQTMLESFGLEQLAEDLGPHEIIEIMQFDEYVANSDVPGDYEVLVHVVYEDGNDAHVPITIRVSNELSEVETPDPIWNFSSFLSVTASAAVAGFIVYLIIRKKKH
jgi:hypothetical protein